MVNGRDKGARGERELARIYRLAGWKAKRGVQFSQGADIGDDSHLTATDIKVEALDYAIHFESKWVENFSIPDLYRAVRKARAEGGVNKIPAVHHKRNNYEWLITTDLDGWFKLLTKQW